MSKPQGTQTKHHFIPEFYQRGFIGDGSGLIWVYRKNREPRQFSVRKLGMELDLYGFTKLDGSVDSNTVEAALSKLESEAALVIRHIEKGFTPDDDQRWTLSRFVSVMWRRTVKHKTESKAAVSAILQNFVDQNDDEFIDAKVKGRSMSLSDETEFRLQLAQELRTIRQKYLGEMPNYLFTNNIIRESTFEYAMMSMDWGFFKSTVDTEFLTCDDPVVFNKPTGLQDPSAVIMFPLSRRLLVQAMWPSRYRCRGIRPTDSIVRYFNRCIVQNAQSQVYASKRSHTLARFVNKWIGTFGERSPVTDPHHWR
jgi:hypothetical protein